MQSQIGQLGLTWKQQFWLAVCIAAVLTICFGGLSLGFGSHGDSRTIFEVSVPAILQGGYAPSRSYGVPLYELAATLFYQLGGLFLVNAYSLTLSVLAIVAFAVLLKESDAKTMAWAMAGFSFNSLFLINATSPTEWAQAFLFLVLMIAFAQSWLRGRGTLALVGIGASMAGLVLTRPDFLVACAAVFLALVWELRLERRATLLLLAAGLCAGLATVATYVSINGGFEFFLRMRHIVGDESQHLPRRTVVAIVGIVNVFGIAGMVALMLVVQQLLSRPIRLSGYNTTFFEKTMLVLWPIMAIRFAFLPDKLEYIYPLIPVTLLACTTRGVPRYLLAVVSASLMLNSIIAVSFFERGERDDRLRFSLQVNESAMAQDWDARRALATMLEPSFQQQLVSSLIQPASVANPLPSVQLINFHPGFTTADGDLIMPEQQIYKIDNPRFVDDRLASRSYRHIFACNRNFTSENIGWRVLQPPPRYPTSRLRSGEEPFRCWPEETVQRLSAQAAREKP